MKKKSSKSIIIFVLFVVIAIVATGVWFLVGQTAVSPSGKSFMQYTSDPMCSTSEICSWFKANNMVASSSSKIDNYRFDVTTNSFPCDSICLTLPSDATSVVVNNVDSDGCTHWNYNIPEVSATMVCNGGNYACHNNNIYGWVCGPWNNQMQYGCHAEGGSPAQTVTNYGGLTLDCSSASRTFAYGVKVFKDGSQIDCINCINNNQKSSVTKTYCDDGTIKSGSDSCPGIRAQFMQQTFGYPSIDRIAILNSYEYVLPSHSFDINISSAKSNYFVGEQASIVVEINNFYKDVTGTSRVQLSTPTVFGDVGKEIIKENLNIQEGHTAFALDIPTTRVTDRVTVTPALDIYLYTANFDGLNYDFGDGKSVSIHSQDKLKLLTVQGDTQNILINPAPIFLNVTCSNNGCPTGYTCQIDSGLCLRTDILEVKLVCQQIGCPVIEGHNYQCTSSGVCAETVSIMKEKKCTSDSNCSEWTGQLATKCDVSSGLCLEEHIYNSIVEKLIQCSSTSDCMVPCDGIQVSCELGRCTYNGECHILTDTQIVEILKDKSCVTDTECQTKSGDPSARCDTITGICIQEKTVIVKEDRTTLIISLIVAIVVLVAIVIIALAKKRRR